MRDVSGDDYLYYGWPHVKFNTWDVRDSKEGVEASPVESYLFCSATPATWDEPPQFAASLRMPD